MNDYLRKSIERYGKSIWDRFLIEFNILGKEEKLLRRLRNSRRSRRKFKRVFLKLDVSRRMELIVLMLLKGGVK